MVVVNSLGYLQLKIKMTEQDRETLRSLQVVSEDEKANWLIDYWCGKNIQGLIQMPFSRHWIMHVEACIKIMDRVCKERRN